MVLRNLTACIRERPAPRRCAIHHVLPCLASPGACHSLMPRNSFLQGISASDVTGDTLYPLARIYTSILVCQAHVASWFWRHEHQKPGHISWALLHGRSKCRCHPSPHDKSACCSAGKPYWTSHSDVSRGNLAARDRIIVEAKNCRVCLPLPLGMFRSCYNGAMKHACIDGSQTG